MALPEDDVRTVGGVDATFPVFQGQGQWYSKLGGKNERSGSRETEPKPREVVDWMGLTGRRGPNSTDMQESRDRSEENKLRLIYEHPTVPQSEFSKTRMS